MFGRLLIGLALGLWLSHGAAQERPGLRILIENLPSDAEKCGVQKSSMESIARLTLRSNQIDSFPPDYRERRLNILYIALNILAIDNINCVFHLSVRVHGNSSVDFSMEKLYGFASAQRRTVLCENSITGIFGKAALVKTIHDDIEQLTKLCLGEMQY